MKKIMFILTASLFVFTLASWDGDKDSRSSASNESASSSSPDNKVSSTEDKDSESGNSSNLNQSSDEDNVGWSEELRNECLDSARATVEEAMFDALLEYSPNMKKEEIVSCICSVSEDILPDIQSYDEIDKEIEKDSTIGIKLMQSMTECSEDWGNAFELFTWDMCFEYIASNAGESFTQCIIDEAKNKYTAIDLMKQLQKNGPPDFLIDEFMYECEGLIEH